MNPDGCCLLIQPINFANLIVAVGRLARNTCCKSYGCCPLSIPRSPTSHMNFYYDHFNDLLHTCFQESLPKSILITRSCDRAWSKCKIGSGFEEEEEKAKSLVHMTCNIEGELPRICFACSTAIGTSSESAKHFNKTTWASEWLTSWVRSHRNLEATRKWPAQHTYAFSKASNVFNSSDHNAAREKDHFKWKINLRSNCHV